MSTRLKFAPALVLTSLVCALAVGCGGDDDSSDNGANNATENNAVANNGGAANNEDNNATTAAYKSGYGLKLTSFQFSADSPGKSLNGVLSQNFDTDLNYPILVLLEFDNLNVEAGTVDVRGGSGLKTETQGQYKWDADMADQEFEPGTINATGQVDAVLPLLNFVATIETETEVIKSVIPIRSLTFDARLRAQADGTEPSITNGLLEGYVTREDGENTRIVLSPGSAGVKLTQVLGVANINHDSDGDGTNDAWMLKATFDAEETVIAP